MGCPNIIHIEVHGLDALHCSKAFDQFDSQAFGGTPPWRKTPLNSNGIKFKAKDPCVKVGVTVERNLVVQAAG